MIINIPPIRCEYLAYLFDIPVNFRVTIAIIKMIRSSIKRTKYIKTYKNYILGLINRSSIRSHKYHWSPPEQETSIKLTVTAKTIIPIIDKDNFSLL